jgi:LysR family hca operon transcriptional activator
MRWLRGPLPLDAQNLLPPLLVSRPIRGGALMIDLVLRHNAANTSPLFKVLLF